MTKCRLEIDGRYEKLSSTNGLTIEELGEILHTLGRSLGKSHKYTLTGIEFNSYDPVIETDEEGATLLLDANELIATKDYDDLPVELQHYADALEKILKERGVSLNVTSENSDRKIKITEIKRANFKPTYHTITTITAKIVSINGKNEAQPYLTIEDYRGKTIRLNIKSNQESELSQFYKKFYIKFRVRVNRNLQTEQQNATLLGFTIPEHNTLFDSINSAKEKYGDIFLNIIDSAKAIRELRDN